MQVNKYSGFYPRGKPFPPDKWLSIMSTYLDEIDTFGYCSIPQLCVAASISETSARKAIRYVKDGVLIPPVKPKGHGKVGVGGLKGLDLMHSEYLYYLWQQNPSLPLYGYCEEFYLKFGITVSEQLILRWFKTAGKYKGSLRKADSRPDKVDTYRNCYLLKQYLQRIDGIDPKRMVFGAGIHKQRDVNLLIVHISLALCILRLRVCHSLVR